MKAPKRFEVRYWKGGVWNLGGEVETLSDLGILRRALRLAHALKLQDLKTIDRRPQARERRKTVGGQKGSPQRRRFGVTRAPSG